MPELIVSVGAALDNSSDIAIGNVIGSNIANIGLIVGVAAWTQGSDVAGSGVAEMPALFGARQPA